MSDLDPKKYPVLCEAWRFVHRTVGLDTRDLDRELDALRAEAVEQAAGECRRLYDDAKAREEVHGSCGESTPAERNRMMAEAYWSAHEAIKNRAARLRGRK